MPPVILLDFTGELDGPSDVPAVQLELGVEVLLSGDGGGVVWAGTLGHVTLAERRKSCEQRLKKGAVGVGVHATLRLLPRCEWCVVQQCLRRTAEVSWSLRGNNVVISTTCSLLILLFSKPNNKSGLVEIIQNTATSFWNTELPLIFNLSWSDRCSDLDRVTSSTLVALYN